jgi:hypothetical protein
MIHLQSEGVSYFWGGFLVLVKGLNAMFKSLAIKYEKKILTNNYVIEGF